MENRGEYLPTSLCVLPVVEPAPAKVNLTLRVLGRRADGYHELASLVAFAVQAADRLSLRQAAAGETRLTVTGPFAEALAGENIIERALKRLSCLLPMLPPLCVALEKNLPVASGLGGGSADAAALLRAAVRSASQAAPQEVLQDISQRGPGENPHAYAGTLSFFSLARELGADVPVCLGSRASFMRGIGDKVTPLRRFPALWAVLINPMAPVPARKTADVFRALNAPLLTGNEELSSAVLPPSGDWESFSRYLQENGNDLEPAALSVMPAAAEVLAALRQTPFCLVARLSGAGPTCFGLYRAEDAALQAATSLKSAFPSWWLKVSELS